MEGDAYMLSKELFQRLDNDFILPQCSDNWSDINFNSCYTTSYKTSYMGLVLDNNEKTKNVFTAVFASPTVFEELSKRRIEDAVLFTHHPMAWDITKDSIFEEISEENLQFLKEHRISLYNLHTPLDRVSDYSTSVNLARAFDGNILDAFFDYHGCKIAVIAQVPYKLLSNLETRFNEAIGHESKLYRYGSDLIDNALVAFCAGGGNEPVVHDILSERGINTLVTGITTFGQGYAPQEIAHEKAKKHKINILGGTHYSTEKFACIKMIEYFNRLGLPCEFINDVPCLADM